MGVLKLRVSPSWVSMLMEDWARVDGTAVNYQIRDELELIFWHYIIISYNKYKALMIKKVCGEVER